MLHFGLRELGMKRTNYICHGRDIQRRAYNEKQIDFFPIFCKGLVEIICEFLSKECDIGLPCTGDGVKLKDPYGIEGRMGLPS